MFAVGNSAGLLPDRAGPNPYLDFTGHRTPAKTAIPSAGMGGKTTVAGDSSSRQMTAYRQPAQPLAPALASGLVPASSEVQQVLSRLKASDAAVRAHEAAHIAAGGSLVQGAASYTYEKGPDGMMYATGGEVSIDVAPVAGDPKATIEKMATVKAAALAPTDPSAADHSVAAAAAQAEAQARGELAQGGGDSAQGAGKAVGAAYSPLRPQPVPVFEAKA
jgi:hypothetical protein